MNKTIIICNKKEGTCSTTLFQVWILDFKCWQTFNLSHKKRDGVMAISEYTDQIGTKLLK